MVEFPWSISLAHVPTAEDFAFLLQVFLTEVVTVGMRPTRDGKGSSYQNKCIHKLTRQELESSSSNSFTKTTFWRTQDYSSEDVWYRDLYPIILWKKRHLCCLIGNQTKESPKRLARWTGSKNCNRDGITEPSMEFCGM